MDSIHSISYNLHFDTYQRLYIEVFKNKELLQYSFHMP